VRQQWLSAELDRLALVEAEVQAADRRVASARSKLNSIKRSNDALVQGLVNARSGAALLRDLQRRVPEGVQLSTVEWAPGGTSLQLSGRAANPLAFARINALQIELARSPLLDPGSVKLRKASRSDDAKDAGLVTFELNGKFRPRLPATAELRLLNELGATGMARRLQLLKAEGLLP
jgi:type IV pilus assembly protein PilN